MRTAPQGPVPLAQPLSPLAQPLSPLVEACAEEGRADGTTLAHAELRPLAGTIYRRPALVSALVATGTPGILGRRLWFPDKITVG